MKRRLKIISAILNLSILISMTTTTVIATDIKDGTVNANSEVQYVSESTWDATIPAYVVPTESSDMSTAYTITLENAVIHDNHELNAKVEYSGSMIEQNGVELPYALIDTKGNTITSGSKILTKSAGNPDETVTASFGAVLTDKAKYAGVYTDTATFTFVVAEKVYTIDEINANDHLYAIGKTKPEYVVARFNEDYSEVTIFKNGEDSDGWMKVFIAPTRQNNYTTDSPMANNAATLKMAIVKDGVQNISDVSFYNCKVLSEVQLAESIVEIGHSLSWTTGGVFENCSALKIVRFPQKLEVIGGNAFKKSGLETADLSNSVINIGEAAFSGSKISEIDIPEKITVISSDTFSNCKNLKTANIPNSVTEIKSNAFQSSGLQEIVIPEGVKKIESTAFQYCSSLVKATLPKSITELGFGTFWGCSILKEFYIPKESQLKNVPDCCFYDCSQLLSIDLPGKVTIIGMGAFWGCRDLMSISLPETLVTIGDRAFTGCLSLPNIFIPKNVNSIGYAIFDTNSADFPQKSLSNIEVDQDNKWYKDIDGVLYTIDETRLMCYPSAKPDTEYVVNENVTTIDDYAFEGSKNLINVSLSKNVIFIKYYAFAGCELLGDIIIPNGVTTIGDYAFSDTHISEFNIPDTVESIGKHAFYNNSHTNAIYVDENNTTYKDIDGVLFTRDGTLMYYPVEKETTDYIIPTGTVTIASDAFARCSNIKSVTFPVSVTDIDRGAFSHCPNLNSITVLNSETNINLDAFSICSNLRTVYGISNSTAETFAAKKGYTFIAQ